MLNNLQEDNYFGVYFCLSVCLQVFYQRNVEGNEEMDGYEKTTTKTLPTIIKQLIPIHATLEGDRRAK
jgi:hypothetical protein